MNSSTPIVKNIQSTLLKPNIDEPHLRKLLPTVLFPEEFSFELHNVSNAVRNGLRRTLCMEVPVYAMNAELKDFESTDPHHKWEIILPRLRMIPIHQSVPTNSLFVLDVENHTAEIRDVKSNEIKIGKIKPVFNETFTICTLAAGCRLRIGPIRIKESFGFIPGDGMHVLATSALCLSLDQTPLDLYTGEGISSSVSNPRAGILKFMTNGTIKGTELIKLSCENIIDRINSVKPLLSRIENVRDEYALVIDGETHTIGVLLMRTIYELYPDIPAITYAVSSDRYSVTMRMRTNDDPAAIFLDAIKRIIQTFELISKHF